MRTHDLIGVLLAGGQSRRMGQDKALLDWHGQPLIEHMIATLHAVGIAHVKISGNRPEYDGIVDAQPGGGPIIGLLSVAQTLLDTELLVVPVDMPRLSVGLLQQLLDAPASEAVRFGELALPMRLRLDDHSRAVLRDVAALAGRERSLLALQARLKVQSLPMIDVAAIELANCNHPHEWQRALTSPMEPP